MKGADQLNGADLFIDIGQSSLQALYGNDSFEFPIERGENGRLTDLCRERLTQGLRGFLNRQGRRARLSAWCAIEARGVSLRRLALPAAARDEFQRVLRLQVESEFPLSPQELAWGWRPAGPPNFPAAGAPARQEVLVAAVKKDTLEDYAGIFAAGGVVPIFTLGALARAALYPPLAAGSCAVLNIGRTHSEWILFDNGAPHSIRILPWGGESITRSIQEKTGVSHDEAEKLKLASARSDAAAPQFDGLLQSALELAAASVVEFIRPGSSGSKIYLTGKTARDPRLAPLLARLLGGGVACESLEPAAANAPSAAIAGLKKAAANPAAFPPLILDLKNGHGAAVTGGMTAWKWAAAAALLAFASVAFPFAESLLLKPRLEKKLAAFNADRGRLDTIDQELAFLQNLKQEQPPYLDALYLLAKSAPPGARLDPLSISRKGDISLRATMGNGQQVTDFRAKLIDSGWFSNVVVEEQSPLPGNRVSVRLTAQLSPPSARKPFVAEPVPKRANAGPMMFQPAPPEAAPMPRGPSSGSVIVAPAPTVPTGPSAEERARLRAERREKARQAIEAATRAQEGSPSNPP